MRANNCAAMKIHLINRTKMLHFKIAKISICQKLCAKTLKLVPAINCNLKVYDNHQQTEKSDRERWKEGGKEGRRREGGRREGGRREGGRKKGGRKEGGREEKKEGGEGRRREGRRVGRREGRRDGSQPHVNTNRTTSYFTEKEYYYLIYLIV